jgi:cytosine deaminase
MMRVLHMGLHVCQVMGYDQINNGLELISTNSARTLNIHDQHGIEQGKRMAEQSNGLDTQLPPVW